MTRLLALIIGRIRSIVEWIVRLNRIVAPFVVTIGFTYWLFFVSTRFLRRMCKSRLGVSNSHVCKSIESLSLGRHLDLHLTP